METKEITGYPLSWPAGWVKSKWREKSRFKTSFTKARDELIKELTFMGASFPIISSNVPLRLDGLPKARDANPYESGVAVYFQYKGKPMVFACDRWVKVEDNLHAVCLTIGAIRGIKRWGVSDMLERAFSGFQALPAPSTTRGWRDVLGFSSSERPSVDLIRERYRQRAQAHHPDKGGSHDRMAEINRAYQEALQAVG